MLYHDKRMTRSLLILTGFGLLLSGCSMLWAKKRTTEIIRPGASPGQYQAIAVIAGGDDRYGIRMSATVRQDLNTAGITALRRTGRWGSENEAVNGLCPRGEAVTV